MEARPSARGTVLAVAMASAILATPAAGALLPLLDQGPTPFTVVTASPWPDEGARVVVLFSLTNPLNANVTLAEFETPEGELVMRVFARDSTLFFTDTSAEPHPYGRVESLSATLAGVPHRLDIAFAGPFALVSLNDRPQWTAVATMLTATTVARASAAYPLEDRPGLIVHRAHFATGGYEHTFTRQLPSLGWVAHDPDGERVNVRPTYRGGHSLGLLDIRTGLTTGSLIGHVSAAVPAHDGRYRSVVSFVPDSRPEPAVGMAVLAGVAGPPAQPDLRWAIITQRHDVTELSWRLDLWLPNGSMTPLGGPWQVLAWHDMDVLTDLDAGTLELVLDVGAEAKRFQVDGLEQVERIAVGDVFAGPRIEDLTAQMLFDDVAVIAVP